MTASSQLPVLPERCGNIRWKGMFIDTEPDLAKAAPDEHICWCVLTQSCFGPDGQVVHESSCNRHRNCYVTT